MKIKNHSLGLENHIQSIRAFSVVIVFLYHTDLDLFSFGYLGVDIFFLISGYVISKKYLRNTSPLKK
jgi:peptidoglycan/LPS O-acetylase OafA/YrhL